MAKPFSPLMYTGINVGVVLQCTNAHNRSIVFWLCVLLCLVLVLCVSLAFCLRIYVDRFDMKTKQNKTKQTNPNTRCLIARIKFRVIDTIDAMQTPSSPFAVERTVLVFYLGTIICRRFCSHLYIILFFLCNRPFVCRFRASLRLFRSSFQPVHGRLRQRNKNWRAQNFLHSRNLSALNAHRNKQYSLSKETANILWVTRSSNRLLSIFVWISVFWYFGWSLRLSLVLIFEFGDNNRATQEAFCFATKFVWHFLGQKNAIWATERSTTVPIFSIYRRQHLAKHKIACISPLLEQNDDGGKIQTN